MSRLTLTALAAFVALFAIAPAAASAAPQLSFTEARRVEPTVHRGDARFDYRITLGNTGDAATSGPITLTLNLPNGVRIGQIVSGSDWTCTEGTSNCSYSQAITAGGGGRSSTLTLRMWLYPEAPDTIATTFVAYGGGSAASATALDTSTLAAAKPFEITSFEAAACALSSPTSDSGICGNFGGFGTAEYAVAGGHPFGGDSSFRFPTSVGLHDRSTDPSRGLEPVENPRNIDFELPAGFIGNLEAVPGICTYAEVKDVRCPASAAVGGTWVVTAPDNAAGFGALFRVVPEDGYVAAFATKPLADIPFSYVLRVRLRSNGDYGVTAVAPLVPQGRRLIGVQRAVLCSYGVRLVAGGLTGKVDRFGGCKRPGDPDPDDDGPNIAANSIPFITNPTRCGGDAPVTALRVDSWQNPARLNAEGFPDLSDPNWKSASVTAPAGTDCEPLVDAWTGASEPSFSFQPDSTRADAAAGYNAVLSIPEAGLRAPGGVGNSHLKDTVVTLPEGIALNPSAADNLGVCTLQQAGYEGNDFPAPNRIHFNTAAPGCPDNSKVATAVVRTPVLPGTLPASVYLAAQRANPFGSDFAIYLVVDDPKTGIEATIPGKVETDPNTGRIVSTFLDNPQAPVGEVDIRFFGGARASLANPDVCANYTTTTALTPWSAADPYAPMPEEIADPSSTATIDTPPAGSQGACATSKAARPFNIDFAAGSTEVLAGSHSPFTVRLQRPEGNQEFDRVEVKTPEGLVAKLAGIPYCSEAQIQQAIDRTATGDGALEKSSPSCPEASRVGTTTIGAGAGPSPIYVSGNVYLAGPYKGAPVSLAFIVPAVAGPFDLGVQVVRTALNIDPRTTQVTAVSDSIPQILRGVPVRVRDIRVDIDREDFTLNPTDCSEQLVTGKITGNSGAVAEVSNRFQVASCANLPFKPKFVFKLRGGTKRGKHPQFTAIVTARPGDANIARVSAALPRSEFLENAHIRTICTRPDFAADNCPKAAIYGKATAWSPLLDEPLSGNVYLRSSDNLLPDLVPDLRGPATLPIRVELAGRTDSLNGGIRNTFDVVPDAPVSRFVLRMQGANKGLLVNSRDICRRTYRAKVHLIAQNGRRLILRPKMRAQCGKGRKAKRRGGHKRTR